MSLPHVRQTTVRGLSSALIGLTIPLAFGVSRKVERLVYAQHGRKLKGSKSPTEGQNT